MSLDNYINLLKLTNQRQLIQMTCYKDRTFCITSYIDGCGNTKCDRNFSEEERTKAVEWWGGDDYPVAMGFFKSDECGYIKPDISLTKIEGTDI